MPLELPDLDDRRYDDLVAEALALIPAHAPEWTNHNASDPGITLVEMFAYLAEMLMYRANRVGEDNQRAFLRLIDPNWTQQRATLADEVHDVVAALRRTDRAVTVADFERLALAADGRAARVRCFVQAGEARVRLVVVPRAASAADAVGLLRKVREHLEPRRLLTTRVDVELPRLCPVGVRLTLALEADAVDDAVRAAALAALARFLDAERGGPDGGGWPFGRDVHVSEVVALLDGIAGVDHVRPTLAGGKPQDELTVAQDPARRLRRNDAGRLVAVAIDPDELPAAALDPGSLELVKLR